MPRHLTCFAASLAVLCLPLSAMADDDAASAPRHLTLRADPEADAPPAVEKPARRHAEERPFAYVLDPTTPGAGDLSAEYAVGMAPGVSADRPLPAVLGAPGLTHSLSIGVGATDRIAPFVTGRVLEPTVAGERAQGAGAAGVRWQLTRPESSFRLTLVGAGMRDFGGAFGVYGRAATSYDFDRLRVAGNLHVERTFASGRDGADVIAIAGTSYKAFEQLRFGFEYVGQDLEEALDGGAEGGARHYLGPTAAVDLGGGSVQLVASPSFGLTQRTAGVVGRVAMLVTF